MKSKLILSVAFLVISNLIFAIGISCWGLINNNYLNDYYNYISLKQTEKYMKIDTLLVIKEEMYTNLNDNTTGNFIVYGVLQSNMSKIKLVVGNEEYFNHKLDKYPVFKSTLTNNYFLKNAPAGYYKTQYRSFMTTMYLKLSLFPLIGLIIYMYKNYRNLI